VAKRKRVSIDLERLKLLCLNVDYGIEGHCRDLVEAISVELAKRHGFDTHKFRNELDEAGIAGAIPGSKRAKERK